MHSYSRNLLFPRGSTWGDGALSLDDDTGDHLEGTFWESEDTEHGTGMPVLLMIVKNDTGSDITVARKFCKFSSSTNEDFPRRIGTFPNDVAGGLCVPLDDAYTNGGTIPDDDLFYVVVRGPVKILTGESVTNLAANEGVASDNAGLIANTSGGAAAGEYVVGTLSPANSYSASTATLIYADCVPLRVPPAAG